jgi:hypothetical protein
MGSLLEWSHIRHSSHVTDSLHPIGGLGMDVEYHICQKRKSVADDFDPCNVELSNLSR